MAQTHREVCETWFRRVWREQDELAIDEMLMPSTKARGLDDRVRPPRVGPDDFKQFHRAMLALIDDVQVDIEHLISEGSRTSALCRMVAKDRKTGKSVEMYGQVFLEIADDKIVDAHNNFDFLSLFEQLGLLQSGTFSKCLAGEKVA